jgi:hypothetical protein
MGRAQDHRVDPGVAERLAQIVGGGQALPAGPLATRRIRVHAEDRAEPLAAGQQADDGAAPPAQADDGDVQHGSSRSSGWDAAGPRVSRRA